MNSSRRPRYWVAPFIWFVLCSIALPTGSLGAQTDACDDLVDLYGLSNPGAVTSAIEDAEAETGLDFHVFAIDDLAAGQDLDAAAFANCSGAYIVPGEVADDTVVLAVSVLSRDFHVVYGENLKDRLDDDVDAIFDRMAAWFQNGDFSQGFVAGVDEAADGLETEPSNGGAWAAGGVGALVGVGGIGVAVAAVRRKNKGEAERAAAEYEKASSKVTSAQARWYDAEEKASFLSGRLTGSSMQRLEVAQDEAAQASRRLSEAWSPVSELDGAQVAEFDDESKAEAFKHVEIAGRIADENTAALQKFETVLDDFEGSIDQMGTLHTRTGERIAAGRQAAETRASEGWQVDTANQRLDQLDKALGHIDAFALRLDVDEMKPALEPLAKEADALATDLDELDERRDNTSLRRTTVGIEAAGQLGRVGAAGTMIDQWKLSHATDSFDDVLGYPAEAAKQLERAQRHLVEADAVGEIPRDVGVLREVVSDLDAADVAIDLADELLDEIDELDVELAAALRDAPAAVAEVQADAAALNEFVLANRADLSPTAPELLREIIGDVAEAEAALSTSPPNSLRAIDLADDVGEDLEEQLKTFQATVVERQRVRNAAQGQLRSTQTALDRADRHVDSHIFSGRQDKSAQEQINRMRTELNQLARTVQDDPEGVITRAKSIANIADQLYVEAQRRQRTSRGGGGVILGGGGGSRSRSRSTSRSRSRGRSSSRSRSRSSSRRSGGRRGKF